MIDELILHIGMPKTGTTSIQRSLNAVQRGDDWTYVDLNPPHSANPVILRAHGNASPLVTHPGPAQARSPEAARAHLSSALDAVRTPRAILSAEAMVRLPPSVVSSLLDHVSRHARNLRVVAYIRPTYSFVTSYVQQFYKTAHDPLAVVLHRAARPIPADIALWDHALGSENVTLHPYVPSTFPGGSVVRHFAETMALGSLPEHDRNANVSLGDEATRLLYQFRRMYPRRDVADGHILHRLAKLDGTTFRLHPDALAALHPLAEATADWAKVRMGWEVSETVPVAAPRSIRNDADFDDLLPGTLDWLGAQTGRSVASLAADPAAVADAVCALRDRQSVPASVLHSMAARLRLA